MLNFLKLKITKAVIIYTLSISLNIVMIYFQIWGQGKINNKEKVVLQRYVKTKENLTIISPKETLIYLLDGFITKSTTLKLPKGVGLNKENKEILLENIMAFILTHYPESTILKSNNEIILADLGYLRQKTHFSEWGKVRMVIFVAGSKDNYTLYLIASVKVASGNPFIPPPSKEFTQLRGEYAHDMGKYLEKFLSELGKEISEPTTNPRD